MDAMLKYDKIKFFNNKNLLRKKFGVHADLIEPFFREVVSYAPAREREIFEKLRGTKMRYADNEKVFDADGYAIRLNMRRQYYNSIKLNNTDYVDRGVYDDKGEWLHDKTDEEVVAEVLDYYFKSYKSRKYWKNLLKIRKNKKMQEEWREHSAYVRTSKSWTAIHELLHCVECKKMLFLPKNAEFATFSGAYQQAVKPDKRNLRNYWIAVGYGDCKLQVFERGRGKEMNALFNPMASLLLEEAVVDEWAYTITRDFGMFEFDLAEYDRLQTDADYRPFTYFVGMWNLISNNELRKRMVSGRASANSVATDSFVREFEALLLECVDNFYLDKDDPARLDVSEFDPQTIGKRVANVLGFIERHALSVRLNEEEQKYFDYCHKQAQNVQKLTDYMAEFVDFDDDDVEEDFQKSILSGMRSASAEVIR